MGRRCAAWALAGALLAAAAGAASAHEMATSKSITVRAAGPWLQLLVTYGVGAGDTLRELVGVDPGDDEARPSPAQRARLEALVLERATFALRLEVDGVPSALTHTPAATAGVRRADRQLGVALRSAAAWPLFCGWHRVTVGDRAPTGGPIRLRWPDGASEILAGRGGEASRWLWLCGEGG